MIRKKKILVIVITGILIASIATGITVTYNDDDKGVIKTEFQTKLHHTVTQETPFFGLGSEYFFDEGDVTAVFNNTIVYSDVNNDGIYTEFYELQAGDSITIQTPYPGSRVFANKPIICKKLFYTEYYSEYDHIRDYNEYCFVPPVETLKNEYYLPANTWLLSSPENTTVFVDYHNDGSIDNEIIVSILSKSVTTTSYNSRIFSSKPFCVYHQDWRTFVGISSNDFYTLYQDIRLYILENNTEIKFDYNNDGIYDEYYNKNRSSMSITCSNGTHIHSDKNILIFYRPLLGPSGSNNFYYYLMPSTMMGNDMFIPSGKRFSPKATSCFSNTTIYFDSITSNDLCPESEITVDSNQITVLSSYTHFWSTKPFLAFSHYQYYASGSYGGYWSRKYSGHYGIMPNSYIHAIQLHEPNEIGVNDNIEMEIRVFNTFAETYVNNVTVTASIDDDFSISDGDHLTIDISKKWLQNDTLIDTANFDVYLSHIDNQYVFTVSKSNDSIFNCLEPMKYYSIDYTIQAPSIPVICKFEPVTLEYDASTWILSS